MKIIELRAENFKRLSAVHIKPDGTMQVISGKNGAGKTSVLDSVWAALGGKDASPNKPIRKGAESAKVTLDLGEYVVTRKWLASGSSTVTVENKEGASFKSPQAMLDKLFSSLSFDPLAFCRASEREQAVTLRTIAGIDTVSLDGKRKAAYDRRTEANRVLKAEQARLAAMPVVEAPAEPVSIAALLKDREAANVIIRNHERGAEALAKAQGEVAAADAALELAKKRCADAKERLGAVETAIAKMPAAPDVAAIDSALANAETVNANVRRKAEREAQSAAVARASAESESLTSTIDGLDAEKTATLAAAAFPVPGLSVDGDAPTFNGIPLSQASGAEQLRVSLAVAASLNPTLRVVLVRDGSLLDAEGMQLVAEWAAAKDMQVLIERVADGNGVGIIIEDGAVAE